MADTNKIINLGNLTSYDGKIKAFTKAETETLLGKMVGGFALENGENYLTIDDNMTTEYGTGYRLGLDYSALSSAIKSEISLFTVEFYASFEALPSTGEENVLYVVGDGSTVGESNQLSEYIWDAENLRYELIGTAGIDFTYATESDIAGLFTSES